jgi:hypothetical protein
VKSALDKGMLLNQARDGKLIKEAGFAHGCPDMPRQSGLVQGDVKGRRKGEISETEWSPEVRLGSTSDLAFPPFMGDGGGGASSSKLPRSGLESADLGRNRL